MSIKKNFIWNTILKLSTIIFPLIIFPYVSRTVGAEGIGKVSFASSVISYFGIIAQLGVQTYGIRTCAQARDNKDELSRRVQEILIINIISTAISYALLIISVISVDKLYSEKDLIFITSSQLFFDTVGEMWLFSGLEKYAYITVRAVAFKFISLILIFIFVHNPSDYIAYGAILAFSVVGSDILNFYYSRKFITYKIRNDYNFKRHIKPLITFMLMSVANTFYTSLDTVMLGFMQNDTQVGYYNAAIKIRTVLLGLVNSLAVVLLPRASYYIEKHELRKFVDISKKAFDFIIVTGLAFSIYFSLFSKESIMVLSGSEFLPAVEPMLWLMPTVLICGISNLTAIQMLVSLGKEKDVMFSQIVGALIDLVLNYIFIPYYGCSAAAAATMIAEFVILLMQIKTLHKENIKISGYTNFVKIIVSNTLAIVSVIFLKYVSLTPMISLIVSALLYFSVYFIFLCMFKERTALMVLNTFKAVIKKRFICK